MIGELRALPAGLARALCNPLTQGKGLGLLQATIKCRTAFQVNYYYNSLSVSMTLSHGRHHHRACGTLTAWMLWISVSDLFFLSVIFTVHLGIWPDFGSGDKYGTQLICWELVPQSHWSAFCLGKAKQIQLERRTKNRTRHIPNRTMSSGRPILWP